MNGSSQNLQLSTILFFCIFFFSACSFLPHGTSEKSKGFRSPSEAKAIISILKSQNHNLKTIKGVGRITFLKHEEKEFTSRIAWIASAPDKIRITLSSVSGHPIISAASDGQWLYFFSHANGDYYKKPSTSFNMKRFFSISLNPEDIVNILLGRIPVVEYDSTVFMKAKSLKGQSGWDFEGTKVSSLNKNIIENENASVLFLKNKWGNIREKIYLDDMEEVYKIEMIGLTGELVYRVELIEMQVIESHRVPHRIRGSNDHGAGFQLDMDRYWTDAAVSPSVFTLTPPS